MVFAANLTVDTTSISTLFELGRKAGAQALQAIVRYHYMFCLRWCGWVGFVSYGNLIYYRQIPDGLFITLV